MIRVDDLGPISAMILAKIIFWSFFETKRNPISVFIIKVTVKDYMYDHFLLMRKRIEMELKIKNEKNLFILSKQTEL